MNKTIFALSAFLFISTNLFAGQVNYSYDFAGRLVKADYGSGKTIQYTYDNNGNMLSVISVAQEQKSKENTQEKKADTKTK
jgi:YD repeat-containing protein